MSAFPGAGAILTVLFLVAIAATATGALIAVLSTRIIRSVCGLALCCLGLAGLYIFPGSPFIALMQVLIYVGAVCITIVFAVMLAEPDEPPADPRGEGSGWLATALVAGAGVFVFAAWLAVEGPWGPPGVRAGEGTLRAIGIALLTTYSVPFEVISLVLLVAIVGALAVAHGEAAPVNLLPLYDTPAVYLLLAAFLLALGIVGLLRRRTLIGMLISGEILFMAASLNLLALNRFFAPDPAVGQIFVLFIMGLAAAEVAIGLSIIIAVYRNYRSIRSHDLSDLRE